MPKNNKNPEPKQYIYKVDITVWKETKKEKRIKKIDKSTIGRADNIKEALNLASINVYTANKD